MNGKKNNKLKVCFTLKTNQETLLSYSELYKKLKKNYNVKDKKGLTCFELYNANEIKIKPHIDYEEYIEKNKYSSVLSDEIQEQILEILSDIFESDLEEWAISKDCRLTIKDKKECYKISFHFILVNKKVKNSLLRQFIKEKLYKFEEKGLDKGIDLKVYRDGYNKFRCPMTKKDQIDEGSLLIPINYKELELFNSHLITYTTNCDDIELVVSKIPDNKREIMGSEYTQNEKEILSEIYNIINNEHTVISEKQKEESMLYDIGEKLCGIDHNSNHNYLIHNINTNILKARCHSDKCEDFEQIVYKPKPPTRNFDENYLNNIPIPINSVNNYTLVKQYFEYFIIFMRDTNSFYRIDYIYDNKHKIWERDLKPIKIEGYTDDLYYIERENNEDIPKSFIKKYKRDMNKKSYFNIQFLPFGKDTDKQNHKYYNLFDGFNYNYVLDFTERNNIIEEKKIDLNFLLEHILKYICGNNEKSFDYLMQYFANIIQNPTFVPQIILIFYSKINGTGKSGLTKFLANVIGQSLSFFGSLHQIVDTHTHAHVGKLLNVIEEVDKQITRKYKNELKDYSQRNVAIYNEKNKPQCRIKTYIRYILTTNFHDGVYFDSEDRRYVVYNFEKLDDMKYINKLIDIMNDKFIIYLFGEYLRNYDINMKKVTQWIKKRVLTEEYFSMRCEDSVDEFLKDFVKLECIEVDSLDTNEYRISDENNNIVFIKKNVFFKKLYKEYNKDNNNGFSKGKNKFYASLKSGYSNIIKVKTIKNKHYYKIDLKELFEIFYPGETYVNYHDTDSTSYKESLRRKEKRKEIKKIVEEENEDFEIIIDEDEDSEIEEI